MIKVAKDEHEKFQHKHVSRGPSSDKYHTTESENSDAESSDDEGDEDEDYKGHSLRQQMPRAARSSKKLRQTHLPFSPKQTRLRGHQRKPIPLEEEESEGERVDLRRSGRNKVVAGRVRYDEDYREDNVDDSDDAPVTARAQKKVKKKLKKRGPRPAYGTIRDVEDLNDSDDDSAPLRAHRDFCEKCKDPPAHVLIVQARRKRGKKRSKQEDEDEESDGERASKLGGWVRW